MCGIVAINSKNDMDFPVEELLSLISIKHRGQDDSGFFRSKNKHRGEAALAVTLPDVKFINNLSK